MKYFVVIVCLLLMGCKTTQTAEQRYEVTIQKLMATSPIREYSTQHESQRQIILTEAKNAGLNVKESKRGEFFVIETFD